MSKPNKKKSKKIIDLQELKVNLFHIYSPFIHLVFNTDLLIRNFANKSSVKNNIDNLTSGMLLVSWCAYARLLIDFLCIENFSKDDDILATDYFLSLEEKKDYLCQVNNILDSEKFNSSEFKRDINKYSLHLTYLKEENIYSSKNENTDFNWRVEFYYSVIKKLFDNFSFLVFQQQRFYDSKDEYKTMEQVIYKNLEQRIFFGEPTTELTLEIGANLHKNLNSFIIID